MIERILWIPLFALIFSLAAVPLTHAAEDATANLQRRFDLLLDDPTFARGFWGVMLQSLDTEEVIYQRNADKYLMPASNMKLITAVAAIEELGLDYKFKTRVMTDGSVVRGTLRGNLLVVGSGDPTLGSHIADLNSEEGEIGDPLVAFLEWADRLKAQGIKRIDGDIVGDDSVFDRVRLGPGWAWDYLGHDYAAQISGLQFNENSLGLRIVPGSRPGTAAVVQMIPPTSYVTIDNRVQTVPNGNELDVQVDQVSGANHLVLRGQLPLEKQPFIRSVAVDNPTLYFTTVLKETLQSQGIRVEGKALDIHDRRRPMRQPQRTLFEHESADLRYVLRVLLKISQNLYAETLIKAIAPVEKGKSHDAGRKRVETMLARAGIPQDAYALSDGSGLSRYNFVTAAMLVNLLRFVYTRPYRDEFVSFLPVAGVDGSIRGRMKGTSAEGKVHAKTGSIAYARSLSGYVITRDGETIAFSMIANNFNQSSRAVDYVYDSILQYLASFSRRSTPAFLPPASFRASLYPFQKVRPLP